MKYFFDGLLQEGGWVDDVSVEIDDDGRITSIADGTDRSNADIGEGFAIPGFRNAHSHSFQYAMAGLAESHGSGMASDDFWSWRDAMYRLALSVNPEQLEVIAAMLYSEMIRHGYTHVAEFHYLHHDRNGGQFDNPGEMSERLVAAAKIAGINLTLVPIFYQKGGFGKPQEPEQKRFISASAEDYLRLFESCDKACQEYRFANTGIGIHSLRAVESEAVLSVVADGAQDVPFHIHISEQIKEVEDSLSHLGKRPVRWMLDNVALSDRFNFVHATHLDTGEIRDLGLSNVNVVICPTTEANLGDGVFPLRHFREFNGNWCIGTDSHVSLNPFEELRLLDYVQRLVSHDRKTFVSEDGKGGAEYAIEKTLLAGRNATNESDTGFFEVGQRFNAGVISSDHPILSATSRKNLLNTIVYSSDETMQSGTIVNGRWFSSESLCEKDTPIKVQFEKTINDLANR